jgi:hypothetical protein
VSDQVHAISTLKVLLTNAVYVTCRKLLKIVKLMANFSGEAIFPTLFQVLTIRKERSLESGCSAVWRF